jgi:hypothetical protein
MPHLSFFDRAITFTHDTFTPYAPMPASLLPKIVQEPANPATTPPVLDLKKPEEKKPAPILPPQLPTRLFQADRYTDAVKNTQPAPADATVLPPWAQELDLLNVKFATLRDNPETAKEFFASIYKNCRQFTPLKDFMRLIEENPHIQVPDSFKKTSPDYKAIEERDGNGKVVSVKYERLAPDILIPNGHSEDVAKWLKQATFIEVYNEVFGTDLKDAAVNHKAYEAYRYTGLVLGVTEWALTAGIFAVTASQMVANGAIEMPSAEELVTRPLLTGLVLLSGAATLVSPVGGTRRSPAAQLIQGAAALARRAVNGKWLDLITPIGEFFRRDPTNEFAAKHLSAFGTVKKYAKTMFVRGQTGIIWELYKDVPDQYKWYKVLSKSFKFAKSSIGSSGKDQVDNVASIAPGIAKYLPASNRLVEAGLMFAWTAPIAVLATATSGAEPSTVAGTLGATAMLIGASTVVKTYFDRIKKENLMEALTYDQIIGFGVPLFSYLSTHVDALQNMWAYGAALSGYTLAAIGAGLLIHKNFGKPETGTQVPPAKAA